MTTEKPLSPCVQGALASLPDRVSAWEFLRKLLTIHPEYGDPALDLEVNLQGEKKTVDEWLEAIAAHYPRERQLHTGLVILGLTQVDPVLCKALPDTAIDKLKAKITLS